MKYIIKNKKVGTYFVAMHEYGSHFTFDRTDAKVFKNGWEANKILKKLIKSKEYINMVKERVN